MLVASPGLATDPAAPEGGIQTIYHASGARSGSGLTTMISCTNHGAAAGTIGVSFYNFGGGTSVCLAEYFGVNPGETRTFSINPVASMVNGLNCSSPTTIDQGRIEIIADSQYTVRFACSATLVSASGDPPTALAKLTLYLGTGALPRDVIFADSFDP